MEDDRITDINWNGRSLWIEHLDRGRYSPDILLDTAFINQFTSHVSNVVSLNFNKHTPLLEAETNGLRISIIHEAYARSGRSISIRKSPAIQRLNEENILRETYCSPQEFTFIKNCVKAHMNIVICGLTGSGKTEMLKFLTNYIPDNDRVITIEDNLEIHYTELHPDRDGVEIKVSEDNFDYGQAIRASLRQMPDWILLSEARGVEVKQLMESLTTGHHCITTVHTDDVRKIPERMISMSEDSIMAERMEHDIYSFMDICIMMRKMPMSDDKMLRIVGQIGAFDPEKQEVVVLSQWDSFYPERLPESKREKFKQHKIYDPFGELNHPYEPFTQFSD